MNPVPLITGIGLVTPLGSTANDTWEALLAGRFIPDHARVPLEFSHDLPRVSHLAILAARAALDESRQRPAQLDAVVLGTSKGPVERWLKSPSTLSDVENRGGYGLSQPVDDVARELGIAGMRLTVCAACASGLHALIRGAMLIEAGDARRVLVIAAEASIHPLFIGSFKRLGVLAAPGIGCRPFDLHRQGFLMSESAAAVVLEAKHSGDLPEGAVRVERYAMAGDATHLTGIDPDANAVRRAIGHVVGGTPVDLFHAHGTGTAANDPLELAVCDAQAANWPSRPAVYSHKGALGHSLGAAGLVSVVLNALCHRHGVVPPNIRTTAPLRSDHLAISTGAVRQPVLRSLVSALGFGGPIAAVALRST